jgi:signal peptidase II
MTDTGARNPEPEQPGDHDGPPAPAAGRRLVITLFGVAVFVLGADVISKVLVVAHLSGHAPIRLLGGLLTLQLVRNSGAAFSIGTSMTVVFTAIAVGVIIFILRTVRRLRSVAWAITLGLLLGGATGNLTDRLFRAPGPMRGDVVDWIQLPHWPVFNLADSAIVCGGVLAVLLAVLGRRVDGTLETGRSAAGPPAAGPASAPGRHDHAAPAIPRDPAGSSDHVGRAGRATPRDPAD